MDVFQGDMPLADPEVEAPKEETSFSFSMIPNELKTISRITEFWYDASKDIAGQKVGYETAKLSYGQGLKEASYKTLAESYDDYNDNKQFYDAWRDKSIESQYGYDIIGKEGYFQLDANNNVVGGEGYIKGLEGMYDMDAVKGYLLAQRNGYSEKTYDDQYSMLTKQRISELQSKEEGTTVAGRTAGVIAGHIAQPETLMEIAMSPARIAGETIFQGMKQAFLKEGAVVFAGELSREQRVRQHMKQADLEYTLWDSAKNILIGAGLGGLFRSIGSGIVDAKTAKEIIARVGDDADKEIVNRFFRREAYKLNKNTKMHIEMMRKAESDMNNNRPVDVSQQSDIDINTKTDPNIEEINIRDELTKVDEANGYPEQVQRFEDDYAKAEPIKVEEPTGAVKPIDDADIYDGMATKEEGDQLIEEMSALDPELKAEMEAIQAEKQSLTKAGTKALSFGAGDPLGGALGGGAFGGTEALYEDMVENKDLTVEDYLARIGTGALVGAGLGAKYGGKGGTKMFVGAKPTEMGAFSNIADKGVRKWIDDTAAQIKDTEGVSFLSQVLDHPELYKQYPELRRIKIAFTDLGNVLGGYSSKQNMIVLNKNLSKEQIKSTLLHETQHGVQSLEGWARGGTKKDFEQEALMDVNRMNFLNSELSKFRKMIQEKGLENMSADFLEKFKSTRSELKELEAKGDVFERYQALAGEQEARATQAALEYPGIDPYKALEKKEGKLPQPIVKKKGK